MRLVSQSHTQFTVQLSERFIREFLPYAPGEYIKVYIATLDIAAYKKPLVSDIASALNQREMDVISALEYWQGKGLLTIKNEKQMWVAVPEDIVKPTHASGLYTDKSYNDTLQKMFGTHVLKTSEYQMIYDWTDVLKLPKEVCIMVIEYAMQRKGRTVSISYMNAIAKSWAEKKINSVDHAIAEIDRYERIRSGANRVLSFIGGVGRLPSRPEMDLYQKWTLDWGFTQDAIMTAITDLSHTANPSFKYIDTVLESLKEQGAITARKITESQTTSNKIRSDAKALLGMIDAALTRPNLDKLESFKAMGFKQEALMLAFAEAAKRPSVNLNYVESILSGWKKAGLTSKAKITAHLISQNTLITNAYAFYKKAGITKKLSDVQLKHYLVWTDEGGFEKEMMDAVAVYASTAKNPYQYMVKLFGIMAEKGVKTLDAFNAQQAIFNNDKSGKDDYIKRDYSAEDFQADLDHIVFDDEDDDERSV